MALIDPPSWLETDWVLGPFGSERTAAVRRYEDVARAGVGLPPIWDGLNAEIDLGSEAFADEMARKMPGAGRAREQMSQ